MEKDALKYMKTDLEADSMIDFICRQTQCPELANTPNCSHKKKAPSDRMEPLR